MLHPSWPAHLTGRTRIVVLFIAIAGLVLAGRFIASTSEAALQVTEDTPTPTTVVVADNDTPPATDTVVPSATETLPPPATDTATAPAPPNSPSPTQTTIAATATSSPTNIATPSRTPTLTPTSTPTPIAVQLPFSDGFESGTLANWTTIKNMTVQQADVLNGAYAARAAATGKANYARTKLVTSQNSVYFRIRFKVVSKSASNVYVLRFRSPTDTSLLGLYITSTGTLALRNDISGV